MARSYLQPFRNRWRDVKGRSRQFLWHWVVDAVFLIFGAR